MIKIITFMENNLGLHTWMLHNFKSLRLRLFWCKTISGNGFTPQCVFGCTWKIKFFVKPF